MNIYMGSLSKSHLSIYSEVRIIGSKKCFSDKDGIYNWSVNIHFNLTLNQIPKFTKGTLRTTFLKDVIPTMLMVG